MAAVAAPARRPARADGERRNSTWAAGGHFKSYAEFCQARARYRLHCAARRIFAATGALAGLHCVTLAALSGADARGAPGLQSYKEWSAVLASLVGAVGASACAATVSDWPADWWLDNAPTLLGFLHALAAISLAVLQAVALRLLPPRFHGAPLLAPLVQAALLACFQDLCGVPLLRHCADGLALAITAASASRQRALPPMLLGTALLVASRVGLAGAVLQTVLRVPRPEAPTPSTVAAWQEELLRSQAQTAAYLASCKTRRLAQVRTSMALAGALCGAVSLAGGMAPWHAAYNLIATASMLSTAAMPEWALEVMFAAWPSMWAGTCVALLPFHVATEQCMRGYITAAGPSCARLASGAMDGSNLLPFIVHVALGPALRLPGSVCYMFLLLPVIGFVALELPNLTAYHVMERVLLGWGMVISAMLSAHGVLCCDSAEREAHAQSVRLDAEKQATKQFTSYILHEVRVPFSVVRMGIDQLDATLVAGTLRGSNNEEHKAATEMLAAMAASAGSMTRIMNDTLDMAKIETGSLSLQDEPFDCAALLAEVHSIWARPALLAEVKWAVNVDTDGAQLLSTRELRGDKLRVQQILNNLISNALKFSPRGGDLTLDVLVSSYAVNDDDEDDDSGGPAAIPLADAEGVWLTLSVIDTGCGISEEELPNLFKPYSQLRNGMRHAGSTGLGLNLSRTLCMRCGGSLTVASEMGKGSTFTARLPFRLGGQLAQQPAERVTPTVPRTLSQQAIAELVPQVQADSAPERPPTPDEPVPRVLVVDDSRMNCMVLVRVLGTLGVSAEAVNGGQEALDAVLAAAATPLPYTLVLMDRNMPGMDGEACTRALRAAGQTLSIVALTGDAAQEDREALLAAGCTDCLVKPASRDQLIAAIDAAQRLTWGGEERHAPLRRKSPPKS